MAPIARTLLGIHSAFIVFIFRDTSLKARLASNWTQSSSLNFRIARMTMRRLIPPQKLFIVSLSTPRSPNDDSWELLSIPRAHTCASPWLNDTH